MGHGGYKFHEGQSVESVKEAGPQSVKCVYGGRSLVARAELKCAQDFLLL